MLSVFSNMAFHKPFPLPLCRANCMTFKTLKCIQLQILQTYPLFPLRRSFSGSYSPYVKRNHPGFIDFETHYPKKALPLPSILSPYTVKKQQRILKTYEDIPQHLYQGRVIRALSCPKIQHSGRNRVGKVTTRHRSGGNPQRIRFIDFKRGRKDINSQVLRIEYDPTRSAHIALIQYDDGVLSYILATVSMRPGDRIIASEHANIASGNCLPLQKIPVNTIIHNIEIRPGCGGQMIRSAGTMATIISKDSRYATLKLQSSEIRRFPLDCWATIGQVSNPEHSSQILGKAGVSRWLGRRPQVRGVAMNPVDHPHGGGTGAKHTKGPPRSMWGVCRQGFKTRSKKKPLGLIVRRKLCKRLQKKYGLS